MRNFELQNVCIPSFTRSDGGKNEREIRAADTPGSCGIHIRDKKNSLHRWYVHENGRRHIQ